MGTNSKSTHQSYVTAPTAVAEESSLAALAADALASLAPPPAPEPEAIPEQSAPEQQPVQPPEPAEPVSESASAEGLAGGESGGALPQEPEEDVEEELDDAAGEAEVEPAAEETASGAEGLEEPQAEAPSEDVSGAEAGGWQDALTPLPEQLPVGQAFGVPVMVSGLELEGSALSLMSYIDGQDAREVLMAGVTPEAEAALLDALSTSGTKMVTVETTKEVMERLQVDQDLGLAEKVIKAAKSVNHKLQLGLEIPQHTVDYVEQAVAAMNAAATTTTSGPESTGELAGMLAHYQSTINAIQAHLDGKGLPYGDGGKIPQASAYLHPTTKTVTTEVPAPPGEAEPGTVSAVLQNASRIAATVDADGKVHWDGASRQTLDVGFEYAVDLGNGYSAVYRPHTAPPGGYAEPAYSVRGQLEIAAPPGSGHGQELVGKLAALNLSAAPATASEGELAYLKANVTAQGLGQNTEVAAAMNAGAHLAEMHVQELFHAEGHRAVGLDAQGLNSLAREFNARAARAAIPAHTALLRDAVAKATGHASGDALAASAGYQPTPASTAGWLTWSRFDVTSNPAAIASAFAGRSLVHTGHTDKVVAMLRSGVLASTERRRSMGIPEVGKSEVADMLSGGAKSVFLRNEGEHWVSAGYGEVSLVWDKPVALISDASAYGYNDDMYGVINPDHAKFNGKPVRDPKKIAGFTNSDNEVMFQHGIDLRGPTGPSRIVTGNPQARTQVLEVLKSQGVTHLGTLPIEQAVE